MHDLEGERILIIDDDPLLLRLLERTFSLAGAQVYTAASGPDALGLFRLRAHQPGLVILDVMMPEMDGWEVYAHIRQLSDVPVIFLTALGGDEEIVRGLGCGAADYVAKPCSPKVLLARAQAALYRAGLERTPQQPLTYRDDYLTIDLDQRWVLVRGRPVKLSAIEYRVLTFLFRNAGRVLTFQQILDNVWKCEYFNNINYVHAYVWQLRVKLEQNPSCPRYLLSADGAGYLFQKTSHEAAWPDARPKEAGSSA